MTLTGADLRTAADTLEAFNMRLPDIYTENASWRPSELRIEAKHLDAELREEAERAELVEELAHDMALAPWPALLPETQDTYRNQARQLIENGWRK